MFKDYVTETRIRYPLILNHLKDSGVSDCIFNHHVHTDYTLIDKFWNNKTFNSFITVNFEALQHENLQNCEFVCYVTSCTEKEKLAYKFLSKVQEYNKNFQFEIIRISVNKNKKVTRLEKISMKKFSAGFLNSPYAVRAGNSTNTTDVYPDFTKAILPLIEEEFVTITPRAWASRSDSSFRKFMFKQPGLKEIVCLDNNAFKNAQVNTCYTLFDFKNKFTGTRVCDINNNCLVMHLDEETTIPWGDIRWAPVLQKLKKLPGLDLLWKRGSLNLNEINETTSGQKFCKAIGTQKGPINYTFVNNNETCGLNKKKIGFANVGDNDKIGPIKELDDDAVVGHSVVIMEVDTDEERKNLRDYIDSPFVKAIIKAVKSSTPNAKYLFEYVPIVDFTKPYNIKNIIIQAGIKSDEEKLFEY